MAVILTSLHLRTPQQITDKGDFAVVRIRFMFIAGVVAILLALPAVALGAEAKSSKESTNTYDLEFALPTAGKSGCLVCHGDPNLVRTSTETTSSIYVSTETLAASAHAEEICTSCHIDFAFKTPHDNVVNDTDWRATARLACKNCKQHSPQFADYSAGAHSPAGEPGVSAAQQAARREAQGKPAEVPLCGDCHGSHAIPSSEDTAAIAAYHETGMDVCGDCHVDYATTYADYYHGAAYREGAADAPACWDCHGTHEILPASDRRSMVNEQRLAETCGQEGCHVGEVTEDFLGYASLIHGKRELVQENPLWMAYDAVREAFTRAIDTVRAWFG